MLQRFSRDNSGAVAMTMALSMVAIGAAVGAAVDYTRIATARTVMQSAVDAAALRAGQTIISTPSSRAAARRKTARDTFDAIYLQDQNPKVSEFKVTETTELVRVETAASVPTHFGFLIGKKSVAIHAAAEVPIGLSTLEIALGLDNTGSMAWLGKMVELKAAANLFLDVMESARNGGALGAVNVAVVPFNTQVDIGPGYRFSSFLRFDGPGASDPRLAVTSDTWSGCVADRDKPFDDKAQAVVGSNSKSLFPASKCQYSGLSRVLPMTGDFSTLRNVINGMTPTGNTNTTIGMMWSYNVLTKGMPLGDAAQPPAAKRNNKVMIFLTDGLNTEDRFGKDVAGMDARMAKLCKDVKKDGVELFTVRVIEGNEALLRDCASAPENYFNITKASDLKAAFQKIAERLVVLRLSS